MTRLLASAALIAALALPAWADEAREQLARNYVNMPEVQRMMADMFAPEAMVAQFEANIPPNIQINDEQRVKIGDLLSDAMNDMKPQMEQLLIEGSARIFTVAELEALIAFYGSEHGASIMTKMQPFFQDVMGQMAPAMNAKMQSVTPQIVEILQNP